MFSKAQTNEFYCDLKTKCTSQMTDYKERIKINHNSNNNFNLFTISKLHVATGYSRIVFGKRGPYIEFQKHHIIRENIYMPDDALWRIDNPNIFYYEYRTTKDNVKIYLQYKTVDYADYKPDFLYISPFDLYDSSNAVIIQKLKKNKINDI